MPAGGLGPEPRKGTDVTGDDIESIIGRSTGRVTVVVERGTVANFATAVCDGDPVFRDRRVAAARGLPAIPAPPTFPFAMENWGAFPELQAAGGDDGETGTNALAEVLGSLMEAGGLILHGEQELEYHRPVYVGDVLRGESRIVDAYTKEAKGHLMTFVVNETVWTDDATGEPVVTSRCNVLHRA